MTLHGGGRRVPGGPGGGVGGRGLWRL